MSDVSGVDKTETEIATANNRKLVHWPLMGGLLHLVQREEDWAGLLVFSFFRFWSGTRSLRMPALRPASQAGPMRNPREGTSVV